MSKQYLETLVFSAALSENSIFGVIPSNPVVATNDNGQLAGRRVA